MFPPVPPVTLKVCVPPVTMLVGAAGEIVMAVGCVQEAALTT
jgi:hypothetical protein